MKSSLIWLVSTLLFFFLILTLSHAGYSLGDYGLNDVEGTLAALGDFDSDKQTDLFIVRHDATSARDVVDWYRYNAKSNNFEFEAWENPVYSVNPIHSVIPGDYNYDGRLDILITGPDPNSTRGEWYVHIFFGNAEQITTTADKQYILSPPPIGQVALMSITGNLHPDLFGMAINPTSNLPQRAIWSFTHSTSSDESDQDDGDGYGDGDDSMQFKVVLNFIESFTSATNPKLSSATHPYLAKGFAPVLADVNGDCGADLILVTTSVPPMTQLYPGNDPKGERSVYDPTQVQYDADKQVEIWVLDRSSTEVFPYTLHFIFPAQIGILQPTIADPNKDGALDIIIPYCYPYESCGEKNSIEIYYNKQKGMCGSLSLSSGCRSATDLCTADNDFTFDYIGMIQHTPQSSFITTASSLSTSTSTTTTTTTSLSPLDDDDSDEAQPGYYKDKFVAATPRSLFLERTFQVPTTELSLTNLPFQLRISDIDMDGNLDFVFPVLNHAETDSAQLFGLRIDGCDDGDCGNSQFDSLDLADIYSQTGSYAIAFMDFGNTGDIDIIVLTKTTPVDANPPTTAFVTFRNNFHEDTYFLTLLGGNGVCHSWCNGLEFPSPKPYGVNQQGLTFKYTVTALGGSKSPRIFMQGPQSAYTPLNSPYVLSGLGRTSNYIEELYLGIPSTKQFGGSANSNLFQAMIPNSQVVIFPYPITSPVNWGIESFISPTQRLLAVFIAFVATTVACCLVIGILHLREKLAEEKLKKQRQRLFAF